MLEKSTYFLVKKPIKPMKTYRTYKSLYIRKIDLFFGEKAYKTYENL